MSHDGMFGDAHKSRIRPLIFRCCWEQATLRRNTAPDPRMDPAAVQGQAGSGQLQVGSRALFLGRAYFGCIATVLPDVSKGLSKQVILSCLRPVPVLALRQNQLGFNKIYQALAQHTCDLCGTERALKAFTRSEDCCKKPCGFLPGMPHTAPNCLQAWKR